MLQPDAKVRGGAAHILRQRYMATAEQSLSTGKTIPQSFDWTLIDFFAQREFNTYSDHAPHPTPLQSNTIKIKDPVISLF